MNKTVEIDITSISDDEAMDLDFEISNHLIDLNVRHSVASLGAKLVFMLDDIDIIIYNIFINHLKNKNLLFQEV